MTLDFTPPARRAWKNRMESRVIFEIFEAISIISRMERLDLWATKLVEDFHIRYSACFRFNGRRPFTFEDAKHVIMAGLSHVHGKMNHVYKTS